MKEQEEANLVYHLKHGRSMPGCLPLFVLLSGVLVVLAMELVQVRKPEPLRPRGEGNVYYRNDELLHFHVLQRSPLPLRLPISADPAQAPDAETPPLTLERPVELLPAPAPTLFSSAPDSAVLDKAALLELPPAETDVVPPAETDAAGGEREGGEGRKVDGESERDGSRRDSVENESDGSREADRGSEREGGIAEHDERGGAGREQGEEEEAGSGEGVSENAGSKPGQEASPVKEVQP